MTGILIIARLGSTRLEKKHLIEVEGRFFIEWLIERFKYAFQAEIDKGLAKIIIATSISPENKTFDLVATKLNCEVFYGDDNNIPLRQLQCAEHYNLTSIISVDGDDVLCSASSAHDIHHALKNNLPTDYIKTSGLPLGMNVIGYTTDFLNRSIKGLSDIKLETGWGRIFEGANCEIVFKGYHDRNNNLRFTLDYPADAEFFIYIIQHFKSGIVAAKDDEIINFVITNKVYTLNSHLNEEYWSNFNQQKKAESEN